MPKLDEEPHFNFRGLVPSPTPPIPEPLSPSSWCAPIEDEVFPDVIMDLPEPEATNVTVPESEDFMREFNRLLEEECPDLTLPEPVAYGSKRLPEDSE
uniref:Uncharacterized protein n=1 Tax=Knipowitschia caucasica TaxID=637954 RepID=A0AAV2LGS7_KNICA